MTRFHLLRLCAAFLTVFWGAHAQASEFEVAGDAGDVVSGELRFIAAFASFKGRHAEVRVFERDPHSPDQPAQLVGTLDISNLSHRAGRDTVRKFTVPLDRPHQPGMEYFAKITVLEGEERTHTGICGDEMHAACAVLREDTPQALVVNFKEEYRGTRRPVGMAAHSEE